MKLTIARQALLTCALTLIASAGCERGSSENNEGSKFDDNVVKTVSDPQQSTGMLGGNSAPEDAACCTESRDAGSD